MPSNLPRFDGIYAPAKQLVLREWRRHPLRFVILLVAFMVAFSAGSYQLLRNPKISEASSHKFMAFWDGTTPPTGWVCVSCAGGNDFFQVFPRGAATAGGTGGAATHDHAQSLVSHGAESGTVSSRSGNNDDASLAGHTHPYSGDLSGRTATGTSLPVYQNLKVIRYDTVGNPPDIPDGVIVIFDADPGAGWTRYAAQDNNYIRGENDATGTGGASTHTHTFSGSLTAENAGDGRDTAATLSNETHTHTVSGTTASSNHESLRVDVLLYKNTSGSAKSLAGGEIFMSTGAPGSGWTSLSGAGGAFENRFLRGAATYSASGGNADHTPANVSVTSGNAVGTVTRGSGSNPQVTFASTTHNHPSTVIGFDATNNLPPYRDVIIAKKDTPSFTVEGIVYMANESTLGTSGNGGPCNDTAIVSVRVDGGAENTGTCSSSDATFSVPVSPAPSAGNTIAVYLTSTIKANTIYLSDGTPDTGIDLYENRVALGHLNAGPIGIADIDAYDSDQNNTDMLFDAEDTTTDTLDVEAGNELHIRVSETFTPVGNVTTPKMHVRGVYTGASETLTLNGSGTGTARPLYVDGGTFTASSNTTTFTGTAATDIGALTFSNLNIHPASGTQTYTLLAGTLTINGNLSVNNGATLTVDVNTSDPAIVAKGNVTLNALTTWTASATASFTFQPTGTKTWTDSVATKQNLGLVSISGGASTPEIQLGTAVKATDITIAASHELDVVSGSNFALEVTGNWSNSGVFAAQTGTVTFSATDTGNTLAGTMTGSSAFHNLIFNGSGGEWTPSAAVAVTNDLTMTAGSLLGTQNVTVNGSVAGTAGVINLTGGTFEQRVAAAENFGTTSGSTAWTFSSLTFSSSAGSSNVITTQTGGTGGITVSSVMVVGKASDVDRTILDAGNRTWTLSGTGGNPLQTDVDGNGSRITGNTSTLAWTGDNGGGNTTIDQNASGTYNSLTFNNGTETFVLEGNTTTQNGGNVTITAGTLDVTATPHSLTIGGSYSNSGTFTAQGGTVTFSSTSTGRTLAGTLNGGSAFNNLIFNGVGGEWSVNATMLVSNDMTVTNGNVVGASDIQVNGGDLICGASCGTIGFTGGTFTLNGTGNFGTTALASNWTFNNLTIGTTDTINVTTAQGTGTITVSAVLAFANSNTVNAGAKTYVLAGTNGTPFTNAGSIFNADTSTFRYTGNNGGGDTSIYNETYWNLEVNNGSEIYVLTGAQGVDNDLTITAGTLDVTATPHALTISGNYSNSGNFDSRTGSVTFNATDSGNTLAGQMTGTSDDFFDLIFNGVSGAWGFSAAVDVANDFTVTNGAVTANNNNLTIIRDFILANTAGVSYTAGSSTITVDRHFTDTGNKFVQGTSTVSMEGTGTVTGASGRTFHNLNTGFTGFTTTLSNTNYVIDNQITFNGGATTSAGSWMDLRCFSGSCTRVVFNAATTLSGTRGLYYTANASTTTHNVAGGNYGTWSINMFTVCGCYTDSTYTLAGNVSGTSSFGLEATDGSTNNVFNTGGFSISHTVFNVGNSGSSRTAAWTANFGASVVTLTSTGDSFGVNSNGGSHTFNLSTASISTAGSIRFVNGTGTVAASGTTSTITMTPAAATTRTFTTNAQTIDNFTVNGGAGSTVNLDGNLIASDNLTITAGTLDVTATPYNVTIGGNYSNSGTFTARIGTASTVTFNATDTGNTMGGTMTGTSSFNNLTFDGSGGEWTPSAAVTAGGNLTMTAGALLGTQNVTINGHIQGTAGVINLTGGTLLHQSSSSRNFGTTSGSAAWSFSNLSFSNTGLGGITYTTQTGGSGGITVAGILRTGVSGDAGTVELNAGNRTWTLSGTGGDPFQLLASPAGNLTPATSTFTFTGNNGAGDTTVQGETYNNLIINNGSETFNLEGATVGVDVTVTAGTLALNGQTLAATDDLLVDGTLSGSTNVTVNNDTLGTGIITLTGGTFSTTNSNGGNFGTTSGTNNWTFNNVTFAETGDIGGMTITTQTGGSGTITVSGVLTVGNGGDGTGTTLDAGNRTWTLSGTGGDPFQLVGPGPNLTPSTSTFVYTGNNGSGDTTVQSETYNVLQVNNGSEIYNLEGTTVALDVTITAGTLALNGQTLQATNDLTANGTLSGSTNVTVNGSTTGSGIITLSGGQFLQRITGNANETFGSTSGSNNWTFSTLFFRNSDGNNHSITFNPTGSGQVIVSAALTIGSAIDINTLTLNNDTNDRILDVDGSVSIASTAVFEASSSASFTVGDSWANSGTFTSGGGTVTFNASDAGNTLTGTMTGSSAFGSLTFNGTNDASAWSVNNAMAATGTFSIADGAVTQGANIDFTLTGNVSLSSGVNFIKASGTGKFIMDGDADIETFTDSTSPQQDLGHVQIGLSPGTTNLSSDLTATDLTISTGDRLNTRGWEVTLSDFFDAQGTAIYDTTDTATGPHEGDGTITTVGGNYTFSASGTFTLDTDAGTPTKNVFNGAADQTITTGDKTFYQVELNNTGVGGSDDLIISGALDVNGAFTITNGDLDTNANDTNTNVAHDFTIASAGSVDAGTGSWTFDPTGTKTWTDSTSAVQNLGLVTIGSGTSTPIVNMGSNVKATKLTISGSHQLNSNGTKTLFITGAGIAGSRPFINNGTFTYSTGKISFTGNGATEIEAMSGAAGTNGYYDLDISPAGATALTMGTATTQTFKINHDLTIGDATNAGATAASYDPTIDVDNSISIAANAVFTSTAGTLTIGNDWTNGGTFTHDSGTVIFDTTATAVIAGATTFFNFTSTTAAKTLQFTAGQTFTIDTGGLFTITGTADPNEIQIQSTTASQWFINHQGSESVSFAQVINSGCDGASTEISTSNSVDDGNNGTCWLFGSEFAQGSYRFGQPGSGTDIDYTGAPAENAAYTTSGTGDDFRLRMLINVSGSNLAQNGNDFSLQLGEKTGATCTSGVSWADVETASGVIRYFDGGGRSDGDNLTGNAGDPDDGNTVVDQDYEEANVFTNSVAAINSGQDGLWDFSLINHSAVGGKRYCFKAVDASGGGADLTTYNQYPEVIIDEELIFTLDSTSKDWGIIQPGDNPTNQTSTLTTSTNSSTGYVVYAWTTQAMSLTNGFGTFTISDWTGTNASPTAFNNGSFGFGYTTNDNDLTGGTATRFSSGTLYAGFTHTGPGDPVADRSSGPVTGASDQITYRLAATTGQQAGEYETVVVYVASVTF